ncbi:hypothetical protein [Terrabacter sp. Ter38]|uniref:variant leucine-rich repeat-containing protein n=1 Tax=Terrabacter sp. Ter38 TaxID=2926030 RepID=UPI00211780F0|nr:hypothetical protein [Terrabacter sp. Ter38]
MPTINERAQQAADPTTSTPALRELACDRSPKVREAVAANPNAPADLLTTLANDTSWKVRYAVAENPTPNALSAALASTDKSTRGVAAMRDDLDDESRLALQADPEHHVREHLAVATSDANTLADLARDPHPAVRSATLENAHLSSSDIEMLAMDRMASVRRAAAASRRLKPDTLTRLADDRSADVRWAVLVNNPERLDLATKIAQDSDEMNADQARAQLDNPRAFTEVFGNIKLVR